MMNNIFLQIISWVLTAISITGAVLNVMQRRSGFVWWMAANAGWIVVSIYIKLPAQALLFWVYFGISLWGWLSWGKK